MERLEIIRSVVAIFRDILLIIMFVVLVFTGLTVMNFVNSFDQSQLSCENLISRVVGDDFSSLIGGSPVTQTYQPTNEMQELISDVETAAKAGNYETALSKLDELKTKAEQEEMTEAVTKIDELKTAIEQEDYIKVLGTANQLKAIFSQE